MALPTAYATEYALALFMAETIGADLAATLAWTLGTDPAPGSYKRAVYAALRMVGAADVASATDMDRLEAAAILAVLRLAEHQTLHLINISTDGQTVNLREAHQNIKAAIPGARAEARRHGLDGNAVTSTPVYGADLYGPLERSV